MALGLGQVERLLRHNWGLFLPHSTLSREILRDQEKEERSYFQEKKALLIPTLIQQVSAWCPRERAHTGCPNRVCDFQHATPSPLSLHSLMNKLNGCACQTLLIFLPRMKAPFPSSIKKKTDCSDGHVVREGGPCCQLPVAKQGNFPSLVFGLGAGMC